MLRLAEHIGSHMTRVRGPVCQYQDLAGTGNHVNGYPAKDLPLGLCYKGVSGAYDLVHPGDGLRTVGQCGYRLGSSAAEHPVNSGNPSCRQDDGIHIAVAGRGRDHDDLPAAGNLGGDAVHQHRGGVGGGAAGDIQPHPLDGSDLLP